MKKTSLFLSLVCISLVTIMSGQMFGVNNKVVYAVNTLFLPPSNYVIDEFYADIDMCGIEEKIFIFGEKKGKMGWENVNTALINKNGTLTHTNTKNIGGEYIGKHIEDFNGDGQKEILVCFRKGQDTKCMLSDFSHNIPKNIMTKKAEDGLNIRFSFADSFKLSCQLENNQYFSIDLSDKVTELVGKKIYEENGKFINGKAVISSPVKIEPVAGEHFYNLKFTQEIYEEKTGVMLCVVESEMQYTKDTLLIKKIEYGIL